MGTSSLPTTTLKSKVKYIFKKEKKTCSNFKGDILETQSIHYVRKVIGSMNIWVTQFNWRYQCRNLKKIRAAKRSWQLVSYAKICSLCKKQWKLLFKYKNEDYIPEIFCLIELKLKISCSLGKCSTSDLYLKAFRFKFQI